MVKFELNRVDIERESDYLEKMSLMKKNMEAFLNEPFDPESKDWLNQFQVIIDHQSGDGSFRVINTTNVHGGPSFDFVVCPTITGAAILMKVALLSPEFFKKRYMGRLEMALNVFVLTGSVPEAAEGLSEYGLWGFLYKYPNAGKEFQKELGRLEDSERFFKRRVFTYGSLMKGQYNHYFVKDQKMVGASRVTGFEMYDLGSYPGIRKCTRSSTILGEVYELDSSAFKAVNRLEGEGSLYNLVFAECNLNGKRSIVGLYEYAYDTAGKALVASGDWRARNTVRYVWYACYGSNINRDRFAYYIQGGYYEKTNRKYDGCRDKSMWAEERDEVFDGTLYFAKESSSWEGKGVAFFDPNGSGKTQMRLYKVTTDQLDDIQKQEGPSWYSRRVSFGEIDGCDVITLTSETRLTSNGPCARYVNVIREGLFSIKGNTAAKVDAYLKEAKER